MLRCRDRSTGHGGDTQTPRLRDRESGSWKVMAENTQEEGQTLDGEPSQPGQPCVLSLSGACRKARTSQLGAPVPNGGLGCLLKELFVRDQHFSLIKPPNFFLLWRKTLETDRQRPQSFLGFWPSPDPGTP